MLVYLFFACNPQNNGPAVTAPLMGGGMAVEGNGRIWVSDPDGDRVLQLEPDGSILRTIDLDEGAVPNRIAIGDSAVAVVLRTAGELLLIEREGTATHRLAPCPEPRGMLAEGDGLWLACAGGELVQVDLAAHRVERTLRVESDLRDVVRDGEDLWVSRFRTAELLLVNEIDGSVEEIRRPTVVDGDDMPVNRVSDPFSGFAAWRTVAHPEGGVVMLHQRGGDGPIDVLTPTVRPYYDNAISAAAGAPGIVHSAITLFERDGSIVTSPPLTGVGLTVDLAVSEPNAQGEVRYLLAHSGVEGANYASSALHDLEALGTQVVATTGPAHGAAVAFGANDAALTVTRFPFSVHLPSATARLRDDTAPAGFDLFHRSTFSGMACASCHMEGHEDGRTWDFAEIGQLRTQELAQIGNSAPFHWHGDLADMSALMGEVHERRMGATSPLSTEQAGKAIVQFLDQVPPLRPSLPANVSEGMVLEGAEVFERAECGDCHTHPLPTESFDVGTGGAFQVPKLDGMSMRLPLMHNGCATTVAARFSEECGGDKHGKVSTLSQTELDSLVAYLQSL